MNKKQYYALINEYNELLKRKEYNPLYFNEEDFLKIQNALLNVLNEFLYNISKERICHKRQCNFDGILRCDMKSDRIKRLMLTIEQEDLLSEETYQNSCFVRRWFGLFTDQQLPIVGGICLILILLACKLQQILQYLHI